MRKNIIYFFQYLKEITLQLWNLLLVPVGIQGIINFFNLETKSFISFNIPNSYSYILIILVFTISSFSAWKKLKNKLENEVDYEISAEKISIDKYIEDRREEAKEKINKKRNLLTSPTDSQYKDYIQKVKNLIKLF